MVKRCAPSFLICAESVFVFNWFQTFGLLDFFLSACTNRLEARFWGRGGILFIITVKTLTFSFFLTLNSKHSHKRRNRKLCKFEKKEKHHMKWEPLIGVNSISSFQSTHDSFQMDFQIEESANITVKVVSIVKSSLKVVSFSGLWEENTLNLNQKNKNLQKILISRNKQPLAHKTRKAFSLKEWCFSFWVFFQVKNQTPISSESKTKRKISQRNERVSVIFIDFNSHQFTQKKQWKERQWKSLEESRTSTQSKSLKRKRESTPKKRKKEYHKIYHNVKQLEKRIHSLQFKRSFQIRMKNWFFDCFWNFWFCFSNLSFVSQNERDRHSQIEPL